MLNDETHIRYKKVIDLLNAVQIELQSIGLWSEDSLSIEYLSSEEPFSIDKLSLDQWLQFVFIPKIRLICDQQGDMPVSCSVSPVAEEYFKASMIRTRDLLVYISEIDKLITDA
jgi:uncharacterized protein YqcC (DUF446 family)